MEPDVIDDFPDSSMSEVPRIEKSVPSSSSDAHPPGKFAYFCVCNVDAYEWFAFDISDDIEHNQHPPPLKYIEYPIPFHEDDEDGAVNIEPKATANMDWLLGWGILGLKTLYAIDDWSGDWRGPSVWKEGNRVDRIDLRSPGANWERLPQIPNQIAASAHTFVLGSKFYCLGGFRSKNGLESQYIDYDLSVNGSDSLPPPPCLDLHKIFSTAKEAPKPCLPSQNMESEANNDYKMLSVDDGFKPYFYEWQCGQWETEQWERAQWERWYRWQREWWEGEGEVEMFPERMEKAMEELMEKWREAKLVWVREMDILVEMRRERLREIEIEMKREVEPELGMKPQQREWERLLHQLQLQQKLRWLQRNRRQLQQPQQLLLQQLQLQPQLLAQLLMKQFLQRERQQEEEERLLQLQQKEVEQLLLPQQLQLQQLEEQQRQLEEQQLLQQEQGLQRQQEQRLQGLQREQEQRLQGLQRELEQLLREQEWASDTDSLVEGRRVIERKWEWNLERLWERARDFLDESVIHTKVPKSSFLMEFPKLTEVFPTEVPSPSQNIMELERQSPWAMAYDQSLNKWESLPDPPHRPVKVDSIFSAAAEVPSAYIVVGLPEDGVIQIYYVNIKMWKTHKFEICPNFSPNVLSGQTLVVGNKLFWYSVDDRCIVGYVLMKKMWFVGELPIHDHGEHFGAQDVDTPPRLAHLGHDKFCLLWVSMLPSRPMSESKNVRVSRLHCMKLRVTFENPHPEGEIIPLTVAILSCQSYLASGSKFFRGGLVV